MRQFSLGEIQNVYSKKGYTMYNSKDCDMNIFGIRSKNSQSDKFDDWIGFWCKTGSSNAFELFPATTDPGKHWLLTPMRKDGTAIMVPGQYPSLYKKGRHKIYPALEQVGFASYVRDNNKDSELDFDLYKNPISKRLNIFESSKLKTNIHKAGRKSMFVGAWSAGCQVLQQTTHFDILMMYVNFQINAGLGDRFTYTLLEEGDFE